MRTSAGIPKDNLWAMPLATRGDGGFYAPMMPVMQVFVEIPRGGDHPQIVGWR